jgi:tetratricopeptide (TPR) repeat protein
MLLMLGLLSASTVVGDSTDGPTRGRALCVGAFLLGTGLAHHPTIALALPSAAILASPRGGPPGQGRHGSWWPRIAARYWILAVALVVVIPLLAYASLMLRARLDPASNWNRPVTLQTLVSHALALDYRHFDLGWPGLLRGAAWSRLGRVLLQQLSPLVFPLAVLGLAGWPRSHERPSLKPRIAVAVLMVATATFGLRYVTSDVEVFFLPLFAALALSAGLGVGALASCGNRVLRIAGLSAGVVLVTATLGANFRAHDLREMTGAESYARDILDTVPRDGVLFVEAADAFGLLYVAQTLGERSDVTIYDRNANLFRSLRDDFPVPALPGESFVTHRIRAEQMFIDRELSGADPRAILFLGWPGYPTPPRYRLEPMGLLYRILPAARPLENTELLWSSYREEEAAHQAMRTGDPVALAIAATYVMARAERAMFEGDRAAADALFEKAGTLGSADAGVQSYIGTIYGRYGDPAQAVLWFQRAVEVRPSYINGWNNLALAHELTGDVEAAKQALRRSLEIAPGQSDAAASLRRLDGS